MVFTKASQVPTGTEPLFALQLRRIPARIPSIPSELSETQRERVVRRIYDSWASLRCQRTVSIAGGEDCRDHFRDVGTAAPNIGFAREGVACDRFASHRGEK